MVNKFVVAGDFEIRRRDADVQRQKNIALVKTLKLGMPGNKNRHDLSNYVVHFTKGADAYFDMLSILCQQKLIAGHTPFGCSSKKDALLDQCNNRAICFTETPLGFLQKFTAKRSEFGIGFSKKVVLNAGGAPISYVPYNSVFAKMLRELMKRGKTVNSSDRRKRSVSYEEPIWKITPYIEFTRDQGRSQHQFQWEREWRICADEFAFKVSEVAFLVLPQHLHVTARDFFKDAALNNTGPSYAKCPYIDGKWDSDDYWG